MWRVSRAREQALREILERCRCRKEVEDVAVGAASRPGGEIAVMRPASFAAAGCCGRGEGFVELWDRALWFWGALCAHLQDASVVTSFLGLSTSGKLSRRGILQESTVAAEEIVERRHDLAVKASLVLRSGASSKGLGVLRSSGIDCDLPFPHLLALFAIMSFWKTALMVPSAYLSALHSGLPLEVYMWAVCA